MNPLFLLLMIMCFCWQLIAQPSKTPAPVFTSTPKTRIPVDSMYSYTFNAMDSLGRPLNFFANGLPAWLSYSKKEHKISGKPEKAGQYPIFIRAVSGVTSTDHRFMLTVTDNQTLNILALGNSITNGTEIYNSYRRALWKKLHEAKYNFDFIGSWDKHHMGGKVPDPDFDMDHEGHSGWTAADVLNTPTWDESRGNIRTWLKKYTPDIVLVELGTNDVFQCRESDDVIKNFKDLVSALRKDNPSVKIYIALVPPLGAKWSTQNLCKSKPYGDLISDVNKKIAAFVPTVNISQSPVVLIDQFSGIDPPKMMYDDIHPNSEGEEVAAERWFNAIRGDLKKLK